MKKHPKHPKYVKLQAVRDAIYYKTGGSSGSMCDLFLDDIPAADVEEVRHGEWIPNGFGEGFYSCSECDRAIEWKHGDLEKYFPYCHCGAKMDGKGK